MNLLTLHHANKHMEVDIIPTSIFGVHAQPDGTTWVIATGGSILPVKETVSEVKLMLAQIEQQNKEGI